jgi:hypothetical protein
LIILVGVNGAVDDAVDDADNVAEADDSDEADVSAGGLTGRNTGLLVLASIASLSRISRRAFLRRCYLVVTQTFGLAFACRHERNFLLLRRLAQFPSPWKSFSVVLDPF